MDNLKMQEMIDAGECVDVRKVGVEIEPGIFKLPQFFEGVDYADSKTERWIWSIGRARNTGEIFASYGTEFYGHEEEYECLWLR